MLEDGVCPWCYEPVSVDMGPAEVGWEGECPRCRGVVALDDDGNWEAAKLCDDER